MYSRVSPENCKQTESTGSAPPAIPPVWKSETITSWKVMRTKLRPDWTHSSFAHFIEEPWNTKTRPSVELGRNWPVNGKYR